MSTLPSAPNAAAPRLVPPRKLRPLWISRLPDGTLRPSRKKSPLRPATAPRPALARTYPPTVPVRPGPPPSQTASSRTPRPGTMRTMYRGRGPAPVAIVVELVVTAGTAASVVAVTAAASAGLATATVNAQISRLDIAITPHRLPARPFSRQLRRTTIAPSESIRTSIVGTGRDPASRAAIPAQ